MRKIMHMPCGHLVDSKEVHLMNDLSDQRHMDQKEWGCCAPFRGLGPHLIECRFCRGLPPYQVHITEPTSRLATKDLGRKLVGAVPLCGELGAHLTQCKIKMNETERQIQTGQTTV